MKLQSRFTVGMISFVMCVLCYAGPAYSEKPIIFGVDTPQVKVGEPAPNTWSTGHHSIATQGNNVYAVWNGEYADGILFCLSQDGGGLWGRTLQIPNSQGGYIPNIAVDQNHVIHVAWRSYSSIYYSRSTDNGSSWSTPVALNGAVLPSWPVTIAEDGAGHIYVGWQSSSTVAYVSKSSDAGITWTTTAVNLSYKIAEAVNLSAAGGKVFLAYQDRNSDDVYFLSSSDGVAWSGEVKVNGSTDGRYNGLLSMAALDQYRIYIGYWGWDDQSGEDGLVCAHTSNGGTSWDIGMLATTDRTIDISLAASASGEVSVAWEDDNRVVKLSRSADGSATWHTPIVITNQGGDASVAINSSNKALIMWNSQHHLAVFSREK